MIKPDNERGSNPPRTADHIPILFFPFVGKPLEHTKGSKI